VDLPRRLRQCGVGQYSLGGDGPDVLAVGVLVAEVARAGLQDPLRFAQPTEPASGSLEVPASIGSGSDFRCEGSWQAELRRIHPRPPGQSPVRVPKLIEDAKLAWLHAHGYTYLLYDRDVSQWSLQRDPDNLLTPLVPGFEAFLNHQLILVRSLDGTDIYLVPPVSGGAVARAVETAPKGYAMKSAVADWR